jgi:hypothetical protein
MTSLVESPKESPLNSRREREKKAYDKRHNASDPKKESHMVEGASEKKKGPKCLYCKN